MNFQAMLRPVPRTAAFRSTDEYLVWCGSLIEHEGRYYLLYSRWPRSQGHFAWVTCSEIACAVSDDPLGPFEDLGVVLAGRGGDRWDASTVHNPTVVRANGKYYLYYMGNRGPASYTAKPSGEHPEWWAYRNNQRVGVAEADHPAGPWRRFDKPILDVSPGSFDHLVTSNPTVAQGDDGRMYMVYKAVGDGPMPKGGAVICGVAVADDPLGPFVKMPEPIMVNPDNGWSVEDPFIWRQNGRFYALVKDFQGYFTGRGVGTVALFESLDGVGWAPAAEPFAFAREICWEDGETERLDCLERPQLLFREGKPAVLACAASPLGDPSREQSFIVFIPLKATE